jgi:hypothetical protein
MSDLKDYLVTMVHPIKAAHPHEAWAKVRECACKETELVSVAIPGVIEYGPEELEHGLRATGYGMVEWPQGVGSWRIELKPGQSMKHPGGTAKGLYWGPMVLHFTRNPVGDIVIKVLEGRGAGLSRAVSKDCL